MGAVSAAMTGTACSGSVAPVSHRDPQTAACCVHAVHFRLGHAGSVRCSSYAFK